MDGYLQLAAAIVERAVIDYKTALKTYRRRIKNQRS